MKQPACCLCGEKIKANEHFFIYKSGRTACRKCGKKLRHSAMIRSQNEKDK